MKRNLLLCVVILLSITSCIPTHSPVLNDAQCDPPCWKGIIPGRTTKEQALQIVSNLSIVKKDTLAENPKNSRNFPTQICWSFEENGFACGLIRDGTIEAITFSGDQGKFEEVVRAFGEPQFFYLGETVGDAICTYVDIVYPDKGISLNISGNSWLFFCKKSISPRILVNTITYFNPDVYSLLLDEGFFGNSEKKQFGLIEWTGLENLNKLYHQSNN